MSDQTIKPPAVPEWCQHVAERLYRFCDYCTRKSPCDTCAAAIKHNAAVIAVYAPEQRGPGKLVEAAMRVVAHCETLKHPYWEARWDEYLQELIDKLKGELPE